MEQLNEYMLSNDFFSVCEKKGSYHNNLKPSNYTESKNEQDATITQENTSRNNTQSFNSSSFFSVAEDDILFWTFYILKYDYETYLHTRRSFSFEKQQKFSLIEQLQKKKQYLKSHKVKLNNLIEDLGTSHTINLATFVGLCCAYKINIVIYKNKVAEKHQFDESSSTFFMYNKSDKQLHTNKEKGFNIEKIFYIVPNLDKPLKSLTSYKKEELIEIAQLFSINSVCSQRKKSKTKQQLYDEIVQAI